MSLKPGMVFGRLTTIRMIGRAKDRHAIWLCRCTCQTEHAVRQQDLQSGRTRSCGCLLLEARHLNTVTHGNARKGKLTHEYMAWRSMLQRCLNPASPRFRDYGGRGIAVCDRWRESFQNFLDDMGACPAGLSLDRRDNNGSYSPDNCAWVTVTEQCRNTRRNRYIVIDGERRCVAEWCALYGINMWTFLGRLEKGIPAKVALTLPISKGGKPLVWPVITQTA